MSSKIILLSSLIALAGIIGLSAFDSQQVFAATDYVISDDTTGGDCGTLEGTWGDDANTCTFTDSVSIDSEYSLTVDENVIVVIQGGAEMNSVVLRNDGILTNNGIMKFVGGAGQKSGGAHQQ